MSKGKYSAQDFQGWFATNSYKDLVGRELTVGIDAAKTAFYAVPMAGGWDHFDVLYFERQDIVKFVRKLSALDYDKTTVVVEPTGTYSDVLVEEARKAGLEVVRINGSKTNKAQTLFDSVPSMHDGKAAYTLARLSLCGVGDKWEAKSKQDRDLRAIDDQSRHLVKMESQFANPLEAYLARHFPEITEYLSLKSATLLTLISTYGCAEAIASNRREAKRLMQKTGGHLLKEEKIDNVLDAAETTIGVPPTDRQRDLLKYLATMLRTHLTQARAINRQIEKIAVEDERTRKLAPMTGKRTAVAMVAILGNFLDYDAIKMLEKGFGVNLCEHTTGQTRQDKQNSRQGLHISKRAHGRPRGLLYMMALRIISPISSNYCPICAAWYAERLRRNGGIKKKAVIAVMRKLVRALYWIARGKTYDPEKLFDTARLRRLGHL